MKKFVIIIVLSVVAIGVGLTFLLLNLDSINYATVTASVIGIENAGEINDVGEKKFEKNSDVQYLITAYAGYHIKTVKVNGEVEVSQSDFQTNCAYTFEKIKGKHTIEVEFEKDLLVNVSSIGYNGYAEYSEAYAYVGQKVEVKISPKENVNSFYGISYIRINDGSDYYITAIEDFIRTGNTTKGYSLSRNNTTGEYTLFIDNVKKNISVEVEFQIKVIFQYNQKNQLGEDVPNMSSSAIVSSLQNITEFAYCGTDGNGGILKLVGDNVPTGKTRFVGWSCKFWTTRENSFLSNQINIGTSYNAIINIANTSQCNVILIARYE